MLWRSIMAPLLAFLFIPLFLTAASAQPRDFDRDRGGDRGDRGRGDDRDDRGDRGDRGGGGWDLLGSTRIGGFGKDRDVIDVGRREGRFDSLAVAIRGGATLLLELNVIYADNNAQRIDIHRFMRDGERSPPIDLQGRGRAIRSIEIVAKGPRDPRSRVFVDIYAQQARGRETWDLLGEKSVGFSVDRDVIRVGRREGRFSKLALEVKQNDVEILDLTVFFERGPPQSLRVRQVIRAGERTRPIDFVGGDRAIDRIELTYRSRPGFRGQANVAVFGLRDAGPPPPPPPPPEARWEELGCSKAGFLPDHDTIKVGRREGRFSAIRLRVSGNKVNILNLTVVYERGPPDDIPVKSEIREGGETRPLDLRGERRAIDRVELYYVAQPNFKGSAKVCVDGRQ
jgi:hypothetical protein